MRPLACGWTGTQGKLIIPELGGILIPLQCPDHDCVSHHFFFIISLFILRIFSTMMLLPQVGFRAYAHNGGPSLMRLMLLAGIQYAERYIYTRRDAAELIIHFSQSQAYLILLPHTFLLQ